MFTIKIIIVPGLLNHIPVDQLDGHSPIRVSILKRKNTGDEDDYYHSLDILGRLVAKTQ